MERTFSILELILLKNQNGRLAAVLDYCYNITRRPHGISRRHVANFDENKQLQTCGDDDNKFCIIAGLCALLKTL